MTKSDDVRNLLMQTADKLFFERGYEAVGVADICKAVGKAKGLFFYYFEKKENIVKELAQRQIGMMANHLSERLANMDVSASEKLNFVMNALISRQSVGPHAMTYFKDTGIPEWFDFYAHDLKDRYILPVIYDVVRSIEEESGSSRMTEGGVEIIYLGISSFMHKNFSKMADEKYYKIAVAEIGAVLENTLYLPEGTINIK